MLGSRLHPHFHLNLQHRPYAHNCLDRNGNGSHYSTLKETQVTETDPIAQVKSFIGCMECSYLLDRSNDSRPERRTALIALELSQYGIDIAALSETRFSN